MSDDRTNTTIDVSPLTQPCGCPATPELSRRSFLKAAGATGIVAGLASEGMFTRLAFGATPYVGDVLVVLSLRGGMDSLQAVVPGTDEEYAHYANWRPNIKVPQGQLLPLDPSFGLHPSMAPLKPFYDSGSLGIVQAVGMAQPNRSHFSAMEEMERAAPGTSLRTGWLDRVLGLREAGSPFQATQLGSNSGASAFLGPAPELAMWNINGFQLSGAWDTTERNRWDTALRGVHGGAPPVIAAPAVTALNALSTAAQLRAAGYTPANGAVYPDTGLSRALRDVARLIKADVGLQVAAVDYGDWDMHAGQGDVGGGWMVDHLTEFSTALAAFATDLGTAMGDVTLITLTEFGRRIEENGSGGTDHGFGQAVFLLGGGVKGGQVHGDWPGLAPAQLVDGDLDATTDYRNLLASVLEKRCGAGPADVANVFPGIGAERPDVVQQRAS
ncbi:MAG: DUF1501 domain-containing protein [Actinomycetota bacterium]